MFGVRIMRLFLIFTLGALAACGGNSSDTDRPEGMTSEQEAAYDDMSQEGQDYVDEQMEQYDEYCASSPEC